MAKSRNGGNRTAAARAAAKSQTAASAKAQTPAAAKPVGGGAVQAGMDVYDKVVWYCLHLLLILVPLAMSNLTFAGIGNGLPLTYDQFDIAKIFTMRALTIVALAAWGWKMLMSGGKIRRTKVDWLIVAFLAWVALTTVFSVHWPTALFGKYRRFEGFISFVNYAAIFFLTVQMVDRPSRIRSLARSLFIGGSLVAIYGLVQYAAMSYSAATFAGRILPRLAVAVPLLVLALVRAFAPEPTAKRGGSRSWLQGPALPALLGTALALLALFVTQVQNTNAARLGAYPSFEVVLMLALASAALIWGLSSEEGSRRIIFAAASAAAGFGLVLLAAYVMARIGASKAVPLPQVSFDPISWGNLPFEAQRSFSTYGNPDLLGGYMMFPLPVSLGLALSEDSEIWRWVYWIGFSVLMAGVWITELVRGAWIGGGVAFVAIAVAVVMSGYRPRWLDWSGLGVALANITFLVARSVKTGSGVLNVAERVQSITQTSEGSARTRFEIWQAAVAAIKARPIFGWGADTFRLVFPRFKPLAYTKDAGYLSVADNVHDYPLQLASALGIFGFLLLYGVLGMVIWLSASMFSPIRGDVLGALSGVGVAVVVVLFGACIAGLYLLRGQPERQKYVAWAFLGVFGYVLFLSAPRCFVRGKGRERLLMAAFWAASLGYIVHLFFGLSVTGSTFLLWFSFGILLSPMATTMHVEAPSWGSFAAVVALAVLAFFFIYNIVYVVADNDYLKARVSQGDAGTRVNLVTASISLNPFNDMYRAELGLARQDVMMAWLNQAQSQTGTVRSQDISSARQAFHDSEAAMLDVIAFVPTEYDNYVFLSNLYNQAGVYFDPSYFDRAITIAKQAEANVERFGPAVRFQEGLAYQYKGDDKDAIAALVVASGQDPGYIEPEMLLGDIYRRQKDWANAKLWYLQAQKLASGSQLQQVQTALQSVEASAKASGETTPTKK